MAELFSTQELFIPEKHRIQGGIDRAFVLLGLDACQTEKSNPRKHLIAGAEDLTPAATDLVNSIGPEVVVATNSTDLAYRLQPILDAGQSLDSFGQAAVEMSVAVAQNSLEYWESQFPNFSSDIVAQYGDCYAQLRDLSYTFVQAVAGCVGDAYAIAAMQSGSESSSESHFVGNQSQINCLPGGAWRGIQEAARSDFDGAVAGFVGALAASKNIQVALGAGAAAAAGKSVVTAINVSLRLFECAMRPRVRPGGGAAS